MVESNHTKNDSKLKPLTRVKLKVLPNQNLIAKHEIIQ